MHPVIIRQLAADHIREIYTKAEAPAAVHPAKPSNQR
jgi:hypothetical protein